LSNILFLLPDEKLGGAESILKMIADYHKNDSFIHIYFLKKSSQNNWCFFARHKNVKLYYGDFSLHFLNIFSFISFLNKHHRFDKIYSSNVILTGIIGYLIMFGILKTNCFIGRESTDVFKRFSNFSLLKYQLFYFGYRKLNLLIFQTNEMENNFKKNKAKLYNSVNTITISNPFCYSDIKDNDSLFIEYNEYVVAAGRYIFEKGFDILIHSFIKIKESNKNMKLLILGEGKLRLELQSLINSLDLQDCVFLIGHVKNVYPYFKKANVCVVSSRIEGFPNVLLQMISQNTKVVSTLCAGGIENIEGIYSCRVNDKNDLADKIISALNDNTEKNRQLFDMELSNRSITNFISKINLRLNE
tara:strand:+ start:684 stop:1760 length:1077 start_codon:yes stop_codon:yes gene_type:complete